MPKYIDKTQLPQFKYYNFCEGREYGWNFGEDEKPEAYYKAVETNDNIGPVLNTIDFEEGEVNFDLANDDFQRLLNDSSPEVTHEIYERWVGSFRDKTEPWKIMEFIMVMLRAMHKDHGTVQHWAEQIKHQTSSIKEDRKELLLILAMVDEYLTFAIQLRTAQGYPIHYKDGDVAYPKMLLIEDKFYNSAKERKNWIDFAIIKKAVMDACWVITINGESAEKKMIFIIADAGEVVQVSMLDKRNGLSMFFLQNKVVEDADGADNIATVSADAWHCHPRGDYWCNGVEDVCMYCNGTHNCKHKSLSIISAVLYCFQEYQKKLTTEQKVIPKKSSGAKKPGEPLEAFIPDGMMRLYDIKMSEDEFRRTDKFALFGKNTGSTYPSTEKSPHVRRGTMRYNPKTGQKDIKVKGSIIHKDKYTGFTSAERIRYE